MIFLYAGRHIWWWLIVQKESGELGTAAFEIYEPPAGFASICFRGLGCQSKSTRLYFGFYLTLLSMIQEDSGQFYGISAHGLFSLASGGHFDQKMSQRYFYPAEYTIKTNLKLTLSQKKHLSFGLVCTHAGPKCRWLIFLLVPVV